MDGITEGDEGLFMFTDEHDISSFIDNFDDVLKDPLISWPVGESAVQDMLQDSFSNVTDLLQEPSECSLLNSQHSSEMLGVDHNSESVSQNHDTKLLDNVTSLSIVKIESQEQYFHSSPELLKLLKLPNNANVSQEKHALKTFVNDVQSTNLLRPLPVQSVQAHAVHSQPQQILPSQKFLQPAPVQSIPKVMISPQQTSTLQLYSLLPKQREEPIYPVNTLPSYQSSTISSHQVASAISQQIPVQQLILHAQLPDLTATGVQRPFQIVIDSTKLPITCNTPVLPTVTAAPPKVERHRAHNAIEKKYRTSINAKIIEMKNLLFGTDAKIQKSGVLKKAIDHIKYLRNINTRLRQQNMSFKMKLQQLGVLSLVKSQDFDQMESVENIPAPLTPESIGDVQSSSSSSTPPSSPCVSDDCFDENVPMLDRTRVGLCIIMFAFFIFDPFNLVFPWQKGLIWGEGGNQARGTHGSSRVLMSQSEFPKESWFIFTLMSWVLRSFVIGLIFVKLFVFGEPSIKPDSKVAATFWAFKRQADLTLERGEYITASKVLKKCLETVGRPLPTSRLDVACSLTWHMFRQLLYRLWIGKWLTAKALQYFSFRSGDKKEIAWRQQSAKEAALIYHKLHHLYLTGHVVGNSWFVTVIALNAINLAEMAESSLSEENVIEIYIDVAIQLRSTFPKYLQFLARYFLSRARRLCRGQSLTLPYSCCWLFTPVGHRFFVNGEWNCKRVPQIWNSSKQNENKPLDNVTQTFCRYLLEQALSSLLLSQKHDTVIAPTCNSEDNTGNIQALDLLHTLTDCVNNARTSGINRNLKIFGGQTPWKSQQNDVVGCWWTAIGKVAACWLVGDVDGAQQHYKIIENIPEEIEKNDDPIGKALLMAFKARAQALGNKDSENICELLEYCDNGGALLRESIAFASLYPQNDLLKLMHLLCCDWLLSTRSDIWEKETLGEGNQLPDVAKLDSFSKDLKSLHKVCCNMPEAQPKVYMYQATCRMIAGASPIQTQRLLQRSMTHQRSNRSEKLLGDTDSLSAEKDRANALMMTSIHLPTSLFFNNAERKGLVFEAVESLQKIGEKDRITRCRKLLLSM